MTVQIKVLGSGCAKCKKLESLTREVVAENHVDAQISKVEDFMEIMQYKILSTPALVINEQVVFKGVLPSKDEIRKQIDAFSHGTS